MSLFKRFLYLLLFKGLLKVRLFTVGMQLLIMWTSMERAQYIALGSRKTDLGCTSCIVTKCSHVLHMP
jgi:hypothetical protein